MSHQGFIFSVSQLFDRLHLCGNIHSLVQHGGNDERCFVYSDVDGVVVLDLVKPEQRIANPLIFFRLARAYASGLESKPARSRRPYILACSGDHFRAVSRTRDDNCRRQSARSKRGEPLPQLFI
jgi:hypothetical protein